MSASGAGKGVAVDTIISRYRSGVCYAHRYPDDDGAIARFSDTICDGIPIHRGELISATWLTGAEEHAWRSQDPYPSERPSGAWVRVWDLCDESSGAGRGRREPGT